MSTEETVKKRFTCPNCQNNVTAPPEDVADPVECPHCGQTGRFAPAKPKKGEDRSPLESGEGGEEDESDKRDFEEVDAAADALGASEFSAAKPDAKSSSSPAAEAHSRKAPPRRKRKVGPTPPRQAGSGESRRRTRPGYRRHDPKPAATARKEGVSLLSVFLVIVAVIFSVIIIMILIPRNLDFIKGYPARSIGSQPPENLLAEVQQVIGPQDRVLTFTEAEVNAFLNHRVRGRQRGFTGKIVKFKGAYADFEKDRVEFFIERTVMGVPFTMSVRVVPKKIKYKPEWHAGGGSIGQFRMVGSKQFKPITDAFKRMGMACEEELGAVERMMDVKFERDKVTLVPAGAGSSPGSGQPAAPAETPESPQTPEAPAAEPAMEGENGEGATEPAIEGENMEGENMEGEEPGMTPESSEPAEPKGPDSDESR